MKTKLALLVVAACVLAAPSFAGEETPERGKAKATMVDKGPVIDGTFNDPVWQKATVMTLGKVTEKGESPLKTTVRVLIDEVNLYVGFDCIDSNTEDIAEKVSGRRGGKVWEDNCVEVCVSPDPAAGYKHIIANCIGTLFEEACSADDNRDKTWRSGSRVKAEITDGKGWVVTMAIPLKDLGVKPGENQNWRANFTRARPGTGDQQTNYASWAILPEVDFHLFKSFGTLEGVSIK